MTTKKTILIVVLVGAVIAGILAYKAYNQKVPGLDKQKADVTLTADQLIKKFETDEATANKELLDKVIAVNGTVRSVEQSAAGVTVILGDEGSMSSVRCSMDSTYSIQASQIQQGKSVVIKGACTGFNTDELLGSDVILNRSVIEKINVSQIANK